MGLFKFELERWLHKYIANESVINFVENWIFEEYKKEEFDFEHFYQLHRFLSKNKGEVQYLVVWKKLKEISGLRNLSDNFDIYYFKTKKEVIESRIFSRVFKKHEEVIYLFAPDKAVEEFIQILKKEYRSHASNLYPFILEDGSYLITADGSRNIKTEED